METLNSGTTAGIGSFHCDDCGYELSLEAADTLPICPSCGGESFTRSSMFGARTAVALEPAEPAGAAPEWLGEVRKGIEHPGSYLAFEDDDQVIVAPLRKEWTRVGRSLVADIRFDDPTVSRRHALLVRQADGVRVLDDRSMNGVFVNGERVEWSALSDGDEVIVGRHVLRFVELAAKEIDARLETAGSDSAAT